MASCATSGPRPTGMGRLAHAWSIRAPARAASQRCPTNICIVGGGAMPQRNLAVELLRKLLVGEIKTRSQRNVVQARSFTELLERSIRRYQNRAIETAQ